MQANGTTRTAIESAASALTFSRSNGTRQGACPFLNAHRDGVCSKCQDMARHDAGLAAANAAPAVEVEAPVLSKVDQRAFTLLTSGKVHLTFGQKYAIVDGSKGHRGVRAEPGWQTWHLPIGSPQRHVGRSVTYRLIVSCLGALPA